jgi:hypothetical protein
MVSDWIKIFLRVLYRNHQVYSDLLITLYYQT